MGECKHNWREFRIVGGPQGAQGLPFSWPARECIKCYQRQVLSADGWVDDDWTKWPFKVSEVKAK